MYMPDTNQARPQLTNGMTLAAVPTAVRLARLFACHQLSQWGLSQLINEAELNAV